MAKSKLEVRSYICIGGSAPVRFDSLDEKTKAECREKIAENISRTLSRYLSENPHEAKPLFDAQRGDSE